MPDETPPSDSPANAPERLEWLDSLRALAALWVVAHHAYGSAPFSPTNSFAKQWVRFLLHGQLAVTAFIALSGFSLALPVLRRGWRLRKGYGEFVLSRAIRIVPPYLIAIVVTLFVTGLHLTLLGQRLDAEQIRSTGIAALKHLFLIQDLDGTNLIDLPGWSNGVFWTIAVEFKIYLLFPAIVFAIRRWGLGAGAATALAFALAFRVVPGLDAARKPGFIVVFSLGILACALAKRVPPILAKVGVLVAAVVGLACFQTSPEAHQLPRDLLFGLAFAAVLASVDAWPRLKAWLEHPWLASIGESAYSLYLVHVLVIQTITKSLPFWRGPATFGSSLGLILVSVGASLVAARAFYIPFERPFFRRRHRIAENLT